MDNLFELDSNCYVVDTNGYLLECNEAQAKAAGVSKPADLIGMNCYHDIADEETCETVKTNNQKIIRMKRPTIIVENATVNNQQYSFLSYKRPIINSKNKSACLLGLSIQLDPSKAFPKKFEVMNRCNAETYKLIADTACTPSMVIDGEDVTKFERDCLYYLICGMSAKRISYHTNLSHRTVEYYICRMQEKFNCTSNIALVVKAISAAQ